MWLRTDLLPPWTHQSLGLRPQPLSNNISRGSAAASVKAAADYYSDQSVITHWPWSVSTHWFTIKKNNIFLKRLMWTRLFSLSFLSEPEQHFLFCSRAIHCECYGTTCPWSAWSKGSTFKWNTRGGRQGDYFVCCRVNRERKRLEQEVNYLDQEKKKHQEMNELMNEFVFSCEQLSLSVHKKTIISQKILMFFFGS